MLPANRTAAYCCASLFTILGSKLSFSNNSSYTSIEASYWSLQESALSPSCFITPDTAQDVSRAVAVLSEIPSCQFAIKGRGHAPAAGFANIDGGITIDMTNLSSVSMSDDLHIASVGAGASWLDVFKALDPLGVQVAGGRNGAVGVAGLTLGGGISYFSPRVGFTCDTVVNFEIVLSSSEIINANTTSHPDLFRVLKGGLNNFGIVTRIDFTTFPQGELLGGGLAQSIDQREAVFQAFTNIASAPDYDPYASIVMGLIFNSTSREWVLNNSPIYTKPITNPPVYQELFSIPNISDTLSITNLSTLADEVATPPFNWLFFTTTLPSSTSLLSQTFTFANKTFSSLPGIPEGVIWDIAFEPLPTAITKFGADNNSLGTSPSDGNGVILLLSALWSDTSSNGLVHSTAQSLISQINTLANEMGVKRERWVYANYADWSQNPIETYGKENVEFLRGVSQRYDGRGMFQGQCRGGFKLWKGV